jgi:type II secretory pathway component PulJ
VARRIPNAARRQGVTLFEVMTALAISAGMMASSVVVIRSAYTAWQAQEADLEKAAVAHSVLQHVVRGMRQASGVVAISAAANPAGSLTIARTNGTTATWTFSAGTVSYSENGGAAQPLAVGLASMSFQGYRANGVTLTSEPGNVQAIRTAMPVGGNRTVSSFSWVRSW